MVDPRRLLRSRLGNPLFMFPVFLLLSFTTCWLLGTPSRHNTFVPPDFLPGMPETNKVSIVIPTFREAESLRSTISALLKRLEFARSRWEIIVVDDNSQDGTEAYIRKYKVLDGVDISLITRTSESGLSSAVLDGMAAAKGDMIIVMDADGQHPPATVVTMMTTMLRLPMARVVLGVRTQIDEDWPWYRRMISRGATALARPLLRATPQALADPMTGLFGIRAEVFRKADPLNATGFKVALELLLKSVLIPEKWDSPMGTRVLTVPYKFEARRKGTSKLGAKVMMQYAVQIFGLYYYKMGFSLVLIGGVLGVVGWYVVLLVLSCSVHRVRYAAYLCRGVCCRSGGPRKRMVRKRGVVGGDGYERYEAGGVNGWDQERGVADEGGVELKEHRA